MKLNLRAISAAAGILWAAAVLITGLANMVWKGYGAAFLEMVASVYPGYHSTGTIGDLLVGTLYGLADGVIFGWIFGWLYNRLSATLRTNEKIPQQPIEP